MTQKVVWIVNQYNFADAVKTRQTNLCRLLNEHGYDAYIISGSTIHKGGKNRLDSKELLKYIETDEAKGFLIKTSDYNSNIKRVLVALQFQYRLWSLRDKLPKPDVIVSEFAGLFGNVVLRWKAKYGTKVIFDILDLWPEAFVDMGYIRRDSFVAQILYYLEHVAYRNADGIIFSFQGGRDYIIDKGWSKEVGGDVDTSDIGYLNNGIDLKGVLQQKDTYIYEDDDLQTDKFKVVYLGSISEFNGLDILVEAAKILQEHKEGRIVILVYGYGNQEARLRKLVDDYGLTNIKFKGKIDSKYAMSVLSHSDLNVFTFKNTPLLKYGTSPNKLFMYFASGKPVLSLIRPGYDLVEGRKAGISVDNDSSKIADVIVRFNNMSKQEYQEYCQNSKKVSLEYDYDCLVKELIRIING